MRQKKLLSINLPGIFLTVIVIVIFCSFFAASSVFAAHTPAVCVTNTMKSGTFCNWNDGNSWCGGNTLTCQLEPDSAATPPGGVSGGTWNFCNSCSWVLSCNGGYSKCASNNTCITTLTCLPGQTFNPCTNACEGTASMLKLGYDSVSGNSVIQSATYPTFYIPSSGFVGIGTTTPATKLHVYGDGTYSASFMNGFVGIGTITPGKLLEVNGQGKFNNFAYGTTPVVTDLLALATVEYVNGITGGNYLPLIGGTMTGSIAMGNNNISNVNTLTVTKINATTIDPLYSLNGVNYATFAASIAGGVKEECLGKIKINRLAGREYESVIDFSNIVQGSDLWVWHQVVDFNFDNVEVSITPYGKFAQVYYLIEGNKLIFRADRPVEVSYRLTGRRFDWRQWPTKALDQSETGVFVNIIN